MIQLLALLLVQAGPVATIENVHAGDRLGPQGDPDQIVCVRQSRIGTRLDNRRVCRTRAEWDELERDTRGVIDRVQTFPGGCEQRELCQGNDVPGRGGG